MRVLEDYRAGWRQTIRIEGVEPQVNHLLELQNHPAHYFTISIEPDDVGGGWYVLLDRPLDADVLIGSFVTMHGPNPKQFFLQA